MQYGDFSEKNVQKRMQAPNWQQGLYTEQMAKLPHLSFKQTYEKRKEEERRLGPGTYSIDDFLTEAGRKPRSLRGALDQLTPRFANDPIVCRILLFLPRIFLSNRIDHHRQVPMVFRMKKFLKNVGNKVVGFLHLNGIKAQEHYHLKYYINN